jgi:hypothetical protein
MRERGSNPPDGILSTLDFFFGAGFSLVQTQHRGTAIHFILLLPPTSHFEVRMINPDLRDLFI